MKLQASALLVAVLVATVAAPSWAQDSTDGQQTLAINLTLTLDSAAPGLTEQLAVWIEERGGYLLSRSNQAVTLRVPARLLPEAEQLMTELGANIIGRNRNAFDVRRNLTELDAAIVSSQAARDRLRGFLDGADVAETLAFERELRSLQGELERLGAQRAAILTSVQFALLTVYLEVGGQTQPTARPSGFEWVNQIDMYRLLEEFR